MTIEYTEVWTGTLRFNQIIGLIGGSNQFILKRIFTQYQNMKNHRRKAKRKTKLNKNIMKICEENGRAEPADGREEGLNKTTIVL